VPESKKLIIRGVMPNWVTSKDLALFVIGKLGADGGLYRSVEWHGDTIEGMNHSQRSVLPNMMGEMGVKNSYIPPDEITFTYLQGRAKREYEAVFPDPDAVYVETHEFNAADLEPMIACPHTVDNVKPLSEVEGIHVDQAFLGTCTNSRLEDLEIAANVINGRKLQPGTRMIVIPASSEIYLAAMKAGYLQTFVEAGAVVESPGCGACMGNHMGVPAVGEVSISSANRNFRGRMGTKDSEVYLASPAVVAASAIAGKITHPANLG
jgi:3-isopropylmalate/(R)-2-methylmalate dehydratase large subunit